jgi:CheY-like chemotaxis protein/HD-like signal output (HDOD) protein
MILIIDDMPIFRELIAPCLKLAGHDTMCAANGQEGLAMARKHLPDLILLDIAMPGMDGMQVLRALRRDPRTCVTPIVILSVVTERHRIVRAIQAGAQEYMLKSRFTTKDLLARIEKHLSIRGAPDAQPRPSKSPFNSGDDIPPSQLTSSKVAQSPAMIPVIAVTSAVTTPPSDQSRSVLDSEKCIQRIQQATRGKSLSGIVTHVISMAASPRGDSAELANLISSDPVLTARVLGAANSAAYASNSGICTTVKDAVRKIGFSAVRNITAAVGIFDLMPAISENGFNPIRYWLHSLAVAQLGESLVSEDMSDGVSPGEAYLCGLCHDLGEILVRCEFDPEYRQLQETERLSGRPRDELRQEMFALPHGRLVLEALRAIGLPDDIRMPIENLHAGKVASEKVGPLPGMLRMTDRYANGLLLAGEPNSGIEVFERAYVQTVFGAKGFDAPDTSSFCSQVRNLTITLARLGRREESQVLVPLFPKSAEKRVWLARDPQFSECDAVQCALRQMANVKVHPRLPNLEERSTYDYLAVVARSPTINGFTDEAIAHVTATKVETCPKIIWIVSDANGMQPDRTRCPLQMPIQLNALATFIEA